MAWAIVSVPTRMMVMEIRETIALSMLFTPTNYVQTMLPGELGRDSDAAGGGDYRDGEIMAGSTPLQAEEMLIRNPV